MPENPGNGLPEAVARLLYETLRDTIAGYRQKHNCDLETALLAMASGSLVIEVVIDGERVRYVPMTDTFGTMAAFGFAPVGSQGE